MKKVYFLTVAAMALTLAFQGCSNNDDVVNGENISIGEPTSMQLMISAPKAPATYAPSDPNASEDEVTIKNVRVLIYEQTATSFILEQVTDYLLSTDFEPIPEKDAYQLKVGSKISTTTGVKKIYVAMNYTGALPEEGSSIGKINEQIVTLATANALSNGTAGFAMFSTAATDATLVTEDNTDYATANKKTVTVKRLVAKVSVQESETLSTNNKISIDGGVLSNLQFALNNINKTSYLLQKLVGSSPSVVQDNNWESSIPDNFFKIAYDPSSPDYRPVDAYAATINPVYAPENTAQIYDQDGNNLTYVSVRAQFVPDFFSDENGESKGSNIGNAPKTFWTVTRTNGQLYYFDREKESEDFAKNYSDSQRSDKYVNGFCYWRGYLNVNGTPDPLISGSRAGKFDVLRNVYYKASILKIKTLGYPTDQGKVTEPTTLLIDVSIEPWQLHIDDWEF
ncbi:MAG: Mfa1 family fimbria major subunit [Proteiniphilum sp.]|jgi:hypothetical protein|nr:Mfa1 family fimbria major subunit [Proteiniphilum sp.]